MLDLYDDVLDVVRKELKYLNAHNIVIRAADKFTGTIFIVDSEDMNDAAVFYPKVPRSIDNWATRTLFLNDSISIFATTFSSPEILIENLYKPLKPQTWQKVVQIIGTQEMFPEPDDPTDTSYDITIQVINVSPPGGDPLGAWGADENLTRLIQSYNVSTFIEEIYGINETLCIRQVNVNDHIFNF